MRITESAIKAIVQIMENNGLNTDVYSLYFCNSRDGQGMAFNFVKDEIGKTHQFENLKVITAFDVDMDDIVIDLRKVDGRTGLIFTGEQYVS